MHNNQRLLYSESKKPRTGSLNKQNNIKLFNESYINDNLNYALKCAPQLRYDYQKSTRLTNKISKTISEDFLAEKTFERSPLKQKPQSKQSNFNFGSTKSKTLLNKTSFLPQSSQQQIESYTNKLLQNNQLYQQQIFQLKQESAQVRSQLERSIAENIKFRMSADRHEEQIKLKYSQEMTSLVKELKEILAAKEQMESQYNKYIEQINEQHFRQVSGRQQNFVKTQQFFKEKLSNLSNHLSINQEQRQKHYFQASQCKLLLMKQIDQLSFNIEKQRNDKREVQKSSEQMIKIIKDLQKQLKQTKAKLQKSQIQVYKIEKQKNQVIIQLKQQNKSLCNGVKQLQTKIGEVDCSMSQKEIQFSRLQKQLNQMKRQLDDRGRKLLQKSMEFQEIRKQKKLLQQQNSKQFQTFTHQKNHFEGMIDDLQKSLKQLSSQLADIHYKKQTLQKKKQLLQSELQSQQNQNSKVLAELSQIQQLNKKYKKDNVEFLEELEFLNLQNKSMKEDKVLTQNHLKTLEKMCQQLQRSREKDKQRQFENKRFILEKQNQSLKVKGKSLEAMQIQKLISQKFQSQNIQLKEQILYLKEEIQMIVKEYEQKLQQKQEKWKLRVQSIQRQVQQLLLDNKNRSTIMRNQQKYLKNNDLIYERSIEQQIYSSNKRMESIQKQRRSPYIIKNNFELDQKESQLYGNKQSWQESRRQSNLLNNKNDLANEGNIFKKRSNKKYQQPQIERKLNELKDYNISKRYH